MSNESIQIDHIPDLRDPFLIAGFDGWGNALDISRGMVNYLVKKLDARPFGKINPDLFYRFDENRPIVDIREGLLMGVEPPGGTLYAVQNKSEGRDIILLKAIEPNLRWYHFIDAILNLCHEAGVRSIISLGGMYDNVLHTDTVISGLASSEELRSRLIEKKVGVIDYKGPGAIHSTLMQEARKRGFECISLWCHCPYYLQGTTHFGLLSHLGSFLASWGGFDLDTEELETTWKELSKQIQDVIDNNPELQNMVNDLRKAKFKGSWDNARKHDKVIHLEDFLKSR